MAYFEVHKLNLKRGRFELKDISFSINKGDFLSIVGKTGSGKTTLIETMVGILKPEGEIVLDGEKITDKPIEKRKIGLVYQDFMLFENMNIEKNLRFPKNFDEKLFKEIINTFEIENLLNLYPKQISGGEKQKVAIARAILSKPKLLIFDEPLSSIDFSFRRFFLEFIDEIHNRFGLTIIYVTHNLKEALKLSNKCGILINGSLIQFGDTKTVFEKPNTREVAEFLGFKNILPGHLINSKKAFFSVSPYKVSINSTGDFKFTATLIKTRARDFGYEITAKIDKYTISIATKDLPNKRFLLSFKKSDIAEFD